MVMGSRQGRSKITDDGKSALMILKEADEVGLDRLLERHHRQVLEQCRVVEINGSEEEHRAAYDQWIAIVGGKGAVVDLSSQRGKGAATGEARLVQSVATVVVEARLGQTKGTTGNLPALDSEAYEEDEEV
ncbi:hypothetical protein GW17_00027817 [Ensete ventricosum]|nr:hypothetical protein GW17_00027817 [Ensete ventricosum]RZS02260.1 hypothetical protein BHM03_00032269 [Ensete ventricosum]